MPSWVAFAVIGLLEQHFGRLVDYDFTAAMEDELDEIASGNEQRTNWLHNFYFGGEHGVAGLDRPRRWAEEAGRRATSRGSTPERSTPSSCSTTSRAAPIYVRVGKNGPYLERMITGDDGEPTPQRANLSDEITPDELTLELAETAFRHTARGPGRSVSTRRPATRSSPGRPLRAVRHRGAAPAAG